MPLRGGSTLPLPISSSVRLLEVQGQLHQKLFYRLALLLGVGSQAAKLDIAIHVPLVVVDAVQAPRCSRPTLAEVEDHLLASVTVFACLLLEKAFEVFESQREWDAFFAGIAPLH